MYVQGRCIRIFDFYNLINVDTKLNVQTLSFN